MNASDSAAVPAPGGRVTEAGLPLSERGGTVVRLERLVGGEPGLEAMVLRFIADKYGAKSLLHLSPELGAKILRRPADFLRAVKQYCAPELWEG